MRLHRLLYYCQAWSLVWDRAPLFRAQIHAWASGPVIPAIWQLHAGRHVFESWPAGDTTRVSAQAQYTISAVVKANETMSGKQLAKRSQQEYPWLFARVGMHVAERGSSVISHASMLGYYSQFWQPSTLGVSGRPSVIVCRGALGSTGTGVNSGTDRYDKLW